MKFARFVSLAAIGLGLASCAGSALGQGGGGSVTGFNKDDAESRYGVAFFPGSRYDPDVPTPTEILGFTQGERPATHEEIERCIQAWASASDRVTLVEYARTYEDRPLYYAIITDPARLEGGDDPFAKLKDDLGRLADPRQVDAAEGDRLAQRLPGVAWMAYSIHGNEASGADGATAAIYHLAASQDADVVQLLKDLVVIIDPMMNPDGRDRYLKRIDESRSTLVNVDNQSMAHTGQWPAGRTNHYLFDLNRDWILGVHPESRGRIAAAGQWHPLLFIDGHEMGSQDSYLFSPSREPVNPNLPDRRLHWWDVFAQDQGEAFDGYGWRYYTGEWNEEWYPGYSSSWAGFRGAVGILYEQARVAPDGIVRGEGTVLTYRESVHHQLVSTMANLRTLQANSAALKSEFLAERRRVVSPDGPFGDRVFAVRPWGNATRLERFIDLMQLQGFDVLVADEAFTAASATNQLGITEENVQFPIGTVLIPNRQPEGALIAAMLEFDPHMSEHFLEWSRREILREGDPKLYDVTSWNLTMMHWVKASVISESDLGATSAYSAQARTGGAQDPNAKMAWVIGGVDDGSVIAAARLMERGVEVRVANKEFTNGGDTIARGSLVITRADNQLFEGGIPALVQTIDEVASELGVTASGLDTGLGAGVENPDLGGQHFVLLERPRIALVGGPQVSTYSYGAAWHAIDQRLNVPVTLLNSGGFGRTDLRRYNVLILPSSFGDFVSDNEEKLAGWVEDGGTLIAIGNTASAMSGTESKLSQVRKLPDVLGDLHEYELAVIREIGGRQADVDLDAVWSSDADGEVSYPWDHDDADDDDDDAPDLSLPDEDELKRRDEWQKLFMPAGTMLAGRIDDRHWLTFGDDFVVPLLMGNDPVLMAKPPVQTAVRVGALMPDEGVGTRRVGWAVMPEGQRLIVRMSGLLWPEAATRVANAAAITRERKGAGQVILFASEPNFRGSTLGTGRIFLNAVVYGPGAGANAPIIRR